MTIKGMRSQSLGENIPDPLQMLGWGWGGGTRSPALLEGVAAGGQSVRWGTRPRELGGRDTDQPEWTLFVHQTAVSRRARCLTFMLSPRCHPGAMSGACRGTQQVAPARRSQKTMAQTGPMHTSSLDTLPRSESWQSEARL